MNTTLQQLKTPLLDGTSIESKREELKLYFQNTWQTYESLFSQINKDEAYFLKPERLRHPLIFYYGHTATFFINKLILGKYLHQRLDQRIESVCAVGVDEMSWDDLNTENYNWPTVTEVNEYRDSVYSLMLNLIDTMELTLPITQDSLAWIVLMGCEHERIHLETSSVIMRMLPLEFLTPNKEWQPYEKSGDAPVNQLIPLSNKQLVLGKKDEDQTYGWDNEYGELTVDVAGFSASKFLVTNQEFLSFIKAGGYKNTDYWTKEGQQWLLFKKPSMPVFWFEKEGEYYQRNLASVMPLPLNWPAEVNYLEAKAFCNWKSEQSGKFIRLPTEAEWYRLRDELSGDIVQWNKAPGNINLESFASPSPVDLFSNGETEFSDIIGNVWQWTESAIDGFNGFNVHPLYDDFSTPTFDGKHNLIKGGSWISTGNEAIKSSRYAFRRHFTQHAGFRYIESDNEDIPTVSVNLYETDNVVCQQLESHYGNDYFNFANYSKTIANSVVDSVSKYKENSAEHINSLKCLDLGCSVGRTSFELSTAFKHVDGVDFSARYIQHGVQLQNNENVRYTVKNEGEIVEFKEISLAKLSLTPSADAGTIHFSQGDAANLKAKYAHYDVILAQHVLEQSYDPALFLASVHQRLNENGLLIVASDYHFDESITAKNKWIGGIKVNGENLTGFDGLTEQLSANFNLLEEQNIPRVLLNNQREFVVSNIHFTVWKKK
ncbi:5-histidylcysteine sulfoxide synthase [Pseudocolwellia sp. HL-MZ19]|uniref:5-histidylcysteine sulfoxide synthase n=1 Tax=unclassified Pseudocolwellia TaxID=2848178 RepID=UPI003CE95933